MSRATLTAAQGPPTDATATPAPTCAASTSSTIARACSRGGALAENARLTAGVAMLTLAGVLIVAVLVDLSLAGQARVWMGYRFRGLPARPNVAVAIVVHNARAVLGVLGLLLVAQLAQRRAGGPGRAQRLILAAGELILAGEIVANVLVVGVGIGAYGERIVLAELPHGPVELAAYSFALGLYLQGRRRALPARHLACLAGASVALLALAATLETFVNV